MDSNQDFGSILNNQSGSSPKGPKQDSGDGFGSLLTGYDQARTRPAKAATTPVDPEAFRSIATQEGADALLPVINAIYGQESGAGTNARTSTDGAQGGMQIIPATFQRYAKAGERIDNPEDNMRVGVRIIKDLANKFGNDPAKIATGYFSGDGNVNPGQGSAWKNDHADGNGKRVSGYVADVLQRVGVAPKQQTGADLTKAPKWADIQAKPEFAKLSPEKQAEAKAAYFDYYIAPSAGDQGAALRQQFLAAKAEPGFMDKVGDAMNSVRDFATGVGDSLYSNAKGSVLDRQGVAPAEELPTTSRVPLRPEVRAAFQAQWDAATPEQRTAMSQREDWVGMLAKERAGVFERSDANNLQSTKGFDPRIEARVQRLVAAGEDPRFAERAAREAAAAGVAPGREIEFMQKGGGLAQKSEFDFDTKQLFDQRGGTNGLNNPLSRGVTKAGLGLTKAVSGYGQFMADVYGLDHAAATAKAGGEWARGKEGAIGESGSFLERNFEGAISSIGQQLPLMIGGVRAGSEVIPLAGMAVQSFGQEYSDGRAAGQTVGEATTRAGIFAAFEVIGEKFGLGDSMKAIKAAARGMPSDQIIGFLWSALKKEVPGELLTTTGQFGADKLPGGVGLNPNATGADYLKQVGDTIAQTIMQSGVMAGGTTGVAKAVRTIRDNGPSIGVAEADAELARQQALNKWNSNGLSNKIEPTLTGTPAAASVTPDGRIEPTLEGSGYAVTPAEPAGAPAIHPTTQAADDIVRELATAAGMPLETVLPTQTQDGPLTDEGTRDQDVLDFAQSRFQQLREKRDGSTQTVVGETGIVDQDMPGAGLSAAEQQELDGLQRAGNDPKALRGLYGFDQQIPSDQSQFANQAQVPAPTTGPVEQPTAGQQFPATTEPGLVAAQENANVETQGQSQTDGLAPGAYAVVPTGQPGGPAPIQEPAIQAPAAQNDAGNAVGNTGQQDGAVPTSDALTDDGIPDIGSPSNMSEADAMRSLGFSEEEIAAATAPQQAKPKTEKERNQQADYSDKWFASQDKAQAFIDKKRIGDTHEVVWNKKRYEIKPKDQVNGTQAPQAQQAEAQGQEAPVAAEPVKPKTEKEAKAKRENVSKNPAKNDTSEKRVDANDKPRRIQPGEPGYTLEMAREDLAALHDQDDNRIEDARLNERIKRQEKLVKEMVAAQQVEKPATPAPESTVAKSDAQEENDTKGTQDGNAQRSDSSTTDTPVASTEEVRPTAASDERTPGDLAGGERVEVQEAGQREPVAADAAKPEKPTATSERVSDRPTDAARQPDGEAANGRTAADTVTSNFTITDELNFAGQGAKTKYANNVAAIQLLKALEADKRQATAAEQAVLAKYIGWGGMPQAFDPKNKSWSKEFAELKELLTADEYGTAVSSTRNAHYTAKPVVEAIWAGLARIGFKNGAVLEPSLGSGNFFGLMPGAARGKSRLFGVEFDHITGGIAKQLYPQAKVNAPIGFQDIKIAPESFDVATGNPPFGDESLYDKSNPEISKFKIHGFFFAKSVETLKPGGVLAMVVSKGLMDANDPRGKSARAWLAERTRLLGAIRLPNSAFQENANTEVTTDIIFLQKLTDGVQANTSEWNAMAEVKDRATGEPIAINKYFAANPDMMLGEMTLAGSMYRANEPTLSARDGDNLPELLAKAIEQLPEGVFKTGKTAFVDAAEKANKVTTADDVREYGYFLKDGKLFQRMPDYNGERQSIEVAKEGKELERMTGMIGLRDAVRKQLALEKNAASTDKEIEANRKALNKAYDDFVKKYGFLNGQTNKRLFADDSDAALVLSLEGKYDKGVTEAVAKTSGQKPRQAKATKATIFEKRVQTPVALATKAGSAKEAMLASLNERGRIDPEFMANLYGKSFDDIVAELGDLVFEDPGQGWVPADLYLSGNVKAALANARAAAEKDASFQRNVNALMKVQPADINPSDIFVKIGSPWVSMEDYNGFVKETFGGKATGSFLPATGNWSVTVTQGTPTENNTTFGTQRMGAHRIIETLMSNKQVGVYDEFKNADGNTVRVLNAEETAAAQGKADALAEAFQDWIWKDNDRRERLSRMYNDTYNTNVKRTYDGSHLTLPGMNPAISLRPHQLNWVYRSLVEGKGLADHVVGAGKTFAIIAAMMEMRRLGLANKPMIVVPNHLVGQWAKDIMALYPGANVLAASRKDFGKDRRKLLFSRIATGDWDMVVVAHSSFGRIPVPADTEKRILDDQLDELIQAIQQAKADKGARFTVKDLERAKTRIEEKLKKLADRKQDNALDFADLGVDALSVDEAHEFKNLFYTTTLQGVAGLGSPQGSTRAFDMFVKTRYVSERSGGKNVFFATGTPLANSIAEVFHMQRFLQYDTLKARGIHNFDAWANTFGQSTSDWEMNAAGKFVQKTRFRKFANLPELKGIWGEISDTVTRADLMSDAEKQGKRFPLPKVKGGRPENVVTERSTLQAEFIGVPQQETDGEGKPKMDDNGQPVMTFKPGTIVYRLENWKQASKNNPKEIPLAITGQARKAGLDYRLIDENAPDFEGSKINAAVSRIYNTWKANDHRKGTQLVFCDLSVPASAKGQATADAAAKTPTFFLRVNGGESIMHVSGVPLTLQSAPDFQFFTHKTGKLYQVIERTTGLTVAEGRTKADAVDAANAKMAKADLDSFGKNVERRSISQEAIDDYITRWEEQQAQADDTGTDDDSAEGAKEISLDEMLADGGGTFSVYDDIKAKLIAKGMPAEQIAFIHDYNTDEKKAALFAAVNGGEIRVLLGSTQKMGAGTNVQSKMVALHHMDAPWRPADLEQREGRIIRQGNEFYEQDPDGFAVEIYRYATKQTYDSRMWEIIETKARAIEQFKADSTLREIEDVSSESANAAEMKAGASGNPLILESISLSADLRKLQAMKKSWERSRFDLEKKIKQAEDKTGWVYNNAKMAAEFSGMVEPKNKDKLGMKMFGVTINSEKDVKADDLAAKMMASADTLEGKKVGSYRGIDIYMRRDQAGVTLFTTHRDYLVSSSTYGQTDKFSVSGFITRVDNLAEGAAKWKDNTSQAVIQFEKDAENAKKELARGFPKDAELKTVSDKHKAVVAALRAGKTSLDGEAPARFNDITRSPSAAFNGMPEAVRVNALQKLEKLDQKAEAGKITDSEFRLGAQQVISALRNQKEERQYRQAVGSRRRGYDWVVAQLKRYVADQQIDREVANFAEWLLDQNPNLANDLGIGVSEKGNVSGDYNDGSRVFRLIAGKANPGTGVHEILHHSERMMPAEVQDGVLFEWQRAWMDSFKKGDKKMRDALLDMAKASMGSKAAYDRVQAAFNDGTLVYDKHYQLYSPSEYWAVNATRILSGRYAAKGSWVKRAVQWFKEFIERIKGVFGLKSDAPIIKALNAVMKGDGQFQPNARMLVDRSDEKTSQAGERTFNDFTRKAQNNAIQFFGNREKSLQTFGKYDKTLSTQFNKALKDKHYGKVFGYVNAMQNEVSLTSIRPAELAPGVLPRVDDVKSAFNQLVKGKKSDKNLDAAASAIFAGTLDGSSVMEGKVWTEEELRNNFGLNDAGVALYQQTRAAIDASLDEVAAAESYAMAQGFVPKAMRRQIIDNPQQAEMLVMGEINKQIKMLDKAIKAAKQMGADQQEAELKAARTNYLSTRRQVEKIFVTAKNLKAAGYAPLMRFGRFTVTVQKIDPQTGNVARDENGESITEFYGQYETEGEAKAVRNQMQAKYADRDDIRVKAGTKAQTGHELYAGISPETLALFAEAIGADGAMRKYIELAMSERSALKRRLERKGTKGYSQDLPRVLSNFITSNGRFAAQRYYLRDLNNAIKYIPKEKGDVLDEAQALKKFVMDPNDPAAPLSSVMFAWFLGGSVASAIVNLTQPVMMTAPYLSQFGVKTATKAMAKALPYAMGKKEITDFDLHVALKRAAQEGIVDAQEIFHLYSVGAQGVASGLANTLSRLPVVGDKIKAGSEDLRARTNAFLTLWGSMFAVAEGFNRKLTFIAAWEVAMENGEKNPYAFAVRAVNETQGIYNKVNRPNWARSAAGRTIMTFKQFSIMYVELVSRMWKRGGPEGKRAALMMLAVLMLAAGEEGLPFAQDLDDLIDTLGQMLGLDTNMKRNKRRVAHEILGKTLGDLFLYGVSSYLPLDFSGRLGLGNLIPGTGLLKPSNEQNRGREVAEIFGPTAGMATQIGDAYDAVTEGNMGKAVQNLAPKAVKDILAAGEMTKKGYSTDAKGRKVVDVTGADAAIKAVGFNPTKVADESRKTAPVYQDIALQKKTETSIVDQWVRGIVDQDEDMQKDAAKRLDDWNRRNPDTQIKVTPDQIRNKARQMATDKDTRLLKQAPREMRGRVGLDLAN